MHRTDMEHLRTDHAEHKQAIREEPLFESGVTFGATVKGLEVLEQDKQQKQQVARLILAVSVLQEPIEDREAADAHDKHRMPDAPRHYPVEYRLPGSAGRIRKFVALALFSSQGDVLNPVGNEVEP